MTRRTIEIIAFCVVLLVAAIALSAWLAARSDRARLQSTLTAQQKVIDAASARESSRQTSLNAALAQIENLKRTTQTPQEILRALPIILPLPQPITPIASEDPANASGNKSRKGIGVQGDSALSTSDGTANSPSQVPAGASMQPTLGSGDKSAGGPKAPTDSQGSNSPMNPGCETSEGNSCAARIPAVDLKPLYDYAQNCRECDLELAAAKQNRQDDATKIAALAQERDAAVTLARGGGFWKRVRRNAIWFAIGAAGGYLAAKR